MAYIRELRNPCSSSGCDKQAVVEVINRFNSSQGSFCRTHGQRRLRELEAAERTAERTPR
jgi:hypothetical protein